MNIHDIAKQAGVSYMTVSRVLNHAASVSVKTRERVEKIIHKNHFVPSQAAAAVRQKSQTLVGLILPRLEYAFYENFINAFTEICHRAGLQPEVFFTHHNEDLETKQILALASRRALGIVVSASRADDPVVLTAREYIKKIIFLRIPDKADTADPECHFIGYDEKVVTGIAARELLKAGHQKILLVSSTTTPFKKQNLPSYRLKHFENHFVEGGGDIVSRMEADNNNYAELLDPTRLNGAVRGSGATAAFCENDFAAHKLYRAAAEAGLRIPDDLSVLAVDDIFSSKYLSPPLSTVALPYETVAAGIIDYFQGKEEKKSNIQSLPPEYRERGSVRTLEKN